MIIFYRGGRYVTRYVTFVTLPVPVPRLPDSGGTLLRVRFQCIRDGQNVVAGQPALNQNPYGRCVQAHCTALSAASRSHISVSTAAISSALRTP